MGARGAYLAFEEPKAVKQRLPVGCDFALNRIHGIVWRHFDGCNLGGKVTPSETETHLKLPVRFRTVHPNKRAERSFAQEQERSIESTYVRLPPGF